jgi:VanZ family protein
MFVYNTFSLRQENEKSMIQIVLIGYILLVIALSLIPTPVASGGMYTDKIAHLLAYGVMGVLAFLSAKSKKGRIYLFTIIVCLGLFLEIFQNYIPGRDMSLLDILANTAGSALGYLLGWLILFSLKKDTEQISC